MARRALVIGSQVGSLQGVHNDVVAVSQFLRAYDFAVDARIEQDASYAGITEGYRRLIAEHNSNDTAIVYYAGHGGLAPGLDGTGRLQFLVPTDCDTVEGEFRGLFSFELSVLLAELTAKGRNVAVILDCCHAATMSREDNPLRKADLVPRALPRMIVEGVADRLKSLAPVLARIPPEGNRDAVRLVATEAELPAYEGLDEQGVPGGIMTNALLRVLQEVGDDPSVLSWAAVAERVRELVIRRAVQQRPEIEGPASRRMFRLEESKGGRGAVAYFNDRGRPSLRAGRLLGAAVGARYAIMPFGITEDSGAPALADAIVSAVDGGISRVTLTPLDATVPDGALAFPRSLPMEQRPIQVEGASTEIIAGSRWLRAVADSERAIATLQASNGTFSVLDPAGAALTLPLPQTAEGRSRARAVLEQLARADAIRTLAPGGLPDTLRVSFGRVVSGAREPVGSGETVYAGESVYLDVVNHGTSPVYFAVLDLGVDGEVALLSSLMPRGVLLAPGAGYTLGKGYAADNATPLIGLATNWPDTVPPTAPLPESFIVLATDQQERFAALEGRAERGAARDPTPLGELMDQLGTGQARNTRPESTGAGSRYLVRSIDFMFSPFARPAPSRRVEFAVDQTLAPAYLQRSASDPQGISPNSISIMLEHLTVHDNRKLWGHADIRVDTLIVTGARSSVRPYAPASHIFPRIRAGESLPFGEMLVFQGQPLRYVDFAIWVSKDKPGAKPLAELLKETLNNTEFQAAATTLAGLAVAAPAAATVVSAAAAAGTLLYFTDKVLNAALGKSIGLYRTSFLGPHYGVGRHPRAGSIRAQDFSFSFDILGTGTA